jgi:RNA 3'-terminal phosphate cyclase-like protein
MVTPCVAQVTDQGKIKRVRGVAWAVRVSPATANRVVETAKGELLKFLPDVYIYTDHFTGAKSGKSPGFGLTLTAETTTGCFLSAEVCSGPAGAGQGPTVPEDLGRQGARALLEEIFRGGCADSLSQALTVTMMGLGPTDVSKFVTGPLSPYTVQLLRHTKDFLQLMFKLETYSSAEEQEEAEGARLRIGADKVLLTCVGVGFTNLSKKTS